MCSYGYQSTTVKLHCLLLVITNGVIITASGSEEERRFRGPGCQISNQTHPVGSQWHPFLPPNGFSKCVICSCNVSQ